MNVVVKAYSSQRALCIEVATGQAGGQWLHTVCSGKFEADFGYLCCTSVFNEK